jgi:hypothetical protein
MTSDVGGIRGIFRALAEARDGPFYSLWVELTYRVGHPVPDIGFRIYKVADSVEATLGVWVSAIRPDGAEICWSVCLETASESLIITASVDISDDDGTRPVFERSADTHDAGEASTLIGVFAGEVCAKRDLLAVETQNPN